MARFSKKRKEEIGLSPYTLYFTGEQKRSDVLLRIIDYDANHLDEVETSDFNEIKAYADIDSTTWLNVDGLHDNVIMEKISKTFELDSLILSDVMNPQLRPKIHEYNNCVFISLKMLHYDEKKNYINAENLVLVIKDKILITFQEVKGDVFDPVRERIRSKKRIVNMGVDYLAFSIIDVVIDNYNYIISCIGERIESVEEKLQANRKNILEEINIYKREIIFLRKNILPCKEMVLTLQKLESDTFKPTVEVHLKDLYDNVKLAVESIDSYREILADQLSVYHSKESSKLNETMKFLTVFSVMFIPLTFIVGVYGTNFDYFPELHFKYGYFLMWGFMLVIALIMFRFFKRKKWL